LGPLANTSNFTANARWFEQFSSWINQLTGHKNFYLREKPLRYCYRLLRY
jgi:hypothetical protein